MNPKHLVFDPVSAMLGLEFESMVPLTVVCERLIVGFGIAMQSTL